jgi:hypothetical protein
MTQPTQPQPKRIKRFWLLGVGLVALLAIAGACGDDGAGEPAATPVEPAQLGAGEPDDQHAPAGGHHSAGGGLQTAAQSHRVRDHRLRQPRRPQGLTRRPGAAG